MAEPKLTDEQLKQELMDGSTVRAIAIKYDTDVRWVQRKKKKLLEKGFDPENDLIHTISDGHQLKGVSTLYNSEGKVTAQWVKTRAIEEDAPLKFKEYIQGLIEDLPKLSTTEIPSTVDIEEDLMAVYPLGDPHIGMLSWERETGENWDLEIAEKVFINIFDRVIKTAPNCKKAIILNLGDFFHCDNMEAITSRSGNRLDVDGRYAKMVQVGLKIIRRMITTALSHHEHVTIINCIGNHDDTGAIFLSVCLKHIYENEPRVSVDDSPAPFHYIKFGKVLIGAHHGHTCKMDKLPSVMASDRYEDWGTTKYRYWMTGHIHHDSKKEFPGCMVESFRTVAAKDAYATYGGWRSGRDTKVIIFHKEYGEIERHTISLDHLQLSDK